MALSDNLISFWKLDEASGNATDSHGSNTLTDNNTVGSGTGKIGNARDFDSASSEKLSIADNASLSIGDVDATFVVWMKPETLSSFAGIFSKRGAGKDYQCYHDYTTNRLKWECRNNSSSDITATATSYGALSTGVWIMVITDHDSTNDLIGISVNNGTKNVNALSGGIRDGADDFQVGANGSTNYYNGMVDNSGFWKRLLSAAERTKLYNSGHGLPYESIIAEDQNLQDTLQLVTVGDGTYPCCEGTFNLEWNATDSLFQVSGDPTLVVYHNGTNWVIEFRDEYYDGSITHDGYSCLSPVATYTIEASATSSTINPPQAGSSWTSDQPGILDVKWIVSSGDAVGGSSEPQTLTVDTGSATYTGVNVDADQTQDVETGSATPSGTDVSVSTTVTVTVDASMLDLSEAGTDLTTGTIMTPDTGTLTLTGSNPSVSTAVTLTVADGDVTLIGANPDVAGDETGLANRTKPFEPLTLLGTPPFRSV